MSATLRPDVTGATKIRPKTSQPECLPDYREALTDSVVVTIPLAVVRIVSGSKAPRCLRGSLFPRAYERAPPAQGDY